VVPLASFPAKGFSPGLRVVFGCHVASTFSTQKQFFHLSWALITSTYFKMTGQLFCRMSLHSDSSDVFPHGLIQVMHPCQEYHRDVLGSDCTHYIPGDPIPLDAHFQKTGFENV
jgi:hypothetical protein